MTRRQFVERTLRQIYGGLPNDDATITVNLVNLYLNDAIGVAAKANYKDNIAIDGISYVNNSFYTIFKGIAVTKDENFLWKVALPQIPFGIGSTEGVSTIEFKDSTTGQISYPVVLMTENQRSFQRGMRAIPNRLIGYPQGDAIYVLSTIQLSQYTASVTMVSGGDSTDLDSTLNVPADYYQIMVEYLKQQLMFERSVPVDSTNDGADFTKTT